MSEEQQSSNPSKWIVFWKENWLTIVVVLVLAGAYVFLRTPGDSFASSEELMTRLQTGGPTVIEFYSNSCSICLLAKPTVDRMERNLEGEAEVLRLDVRDEVGGALAGQWGVRGVPTFFVVVEGEVVYARAGAPDVEAIEAAVRTGR